MNAQFWTKLSSGVLAPAKWSASHLVFALATVLLAGHSHSETLLESYQLAHSSDPKFRAAQADYRASATGIEQARAGYRPVVKFEMEQTTTDQEILSSKNPVFGAGRTTFDTTNQTLSITQAIYRKDVLVRMAQSEAVVRQAELTVLASEQDLLLRTTSAYLSVLAAKDSLALAAAEREALGRALDLAQEKLQMGLGTITAKHDAAARFAVTQAREIEAGSKLQDAIQSLREITGKNMASFESMRAEFALPRPDPEDEESWVQTATDQNLTLRARREALTVAGQEVKRQSSGHYPSLNLVLSQNRRDAGSTLFGGGSNVQTTDVTMRLTVPLYEGGLTSAVIREATHRLERAQEDMELEHRTVDRATRAAYQGSLNGIRLIHALAQSEVSQASALEAKNVGFKAGIYTMLAVLDAQRDLYIAKRDHAQSRYDYLLNVLKLKQAAGTLSESDLLSVHAALQ
jgi:outer membrane protein